MHPRKLKDDSIVEAVCHLQFESSELSEVVVGRLSDNPLWSNYSHSRMQFADIPSPIRDADKNLRYQPILELKSSDSKRLVRIGDRTISYHVLGEYCGWDSFFPELQRAFSDLFAKVRDIAITRAGFRYVNALTEDKHFVSDVSSLNLVIKVGGQPVTPPVNLNFETTDSEFHITTTRIASPSLVMGQLQENVKAVVDVDVHTPEGLFIGSTDGLMDWIEKAHSFEKEAFFRLLPKDILDRLIEE